ncbi:MAG: hypothetical protein IJ087_01925, partial [Eggerthellaceae bacterium]|nr:hypothetical protein [Eggerthellaceae bacterium]
RRTNRCGTERRHLGTGLYRCGVCDAGLKATKGSYACLGHVSRSRAALDAYVTEVVHAELAAMAADPLMRSFGDDEHERELRTIVETERRRVDRVQHDYDEGLIEARDLKRVREKAEAAIAKASAELTLLTGGDALSPMLLAEDPVLAFDESDLAARRAAIASLVEVVVLPVETFKYGRAFNPEYVSVKRVADGSRITVPQREAVAGRTCATCGKPMLLADGCTCFIMVGGEKVARIPVGGPGDPHENRRHVRCGECNAAAGHCHHSGCSREVCPMCGGNFVTCGCADMVD